MSTTSRAERRFYNLLTMAFALPVHATVWFLSTLWIMLGLGAAHHQWPAIPALGYWTTYLIVAGVHSLAALLRTDVSKAQQPSGGAA